MNISTNKFYGVFIKYPVVLSFVIRKLSQIDYILYRFGKFRSLMPTVFMENNHYLHLLYKTKGFIFLQNYYYQSVGLGFKPFCRDILFIYGI